MAVEPVHGIGADGGQSFSAPVPDTGQTTCYDAAGGVITCPSPGENFYGQDANYTINPPSYTQLDGMVKDNVTGLIWEVKTGKDGTKDYENPHDADNTYTWYDPDPATNGGNAGTPGDGTDTHDFITALNNANFGGYSDWRMPRREELRSICDYGRINPAVNTTYFPNTVSSNYWSSTTYASIRSTPGTSISTVATTATTISPTTIMCGRFAADSDRLFGHLILWLFGAVILGEV